MRLKQRLWLVKQIFSITLTVIWLRIFFMLLISGRPILLEEPNAIIAGVEFVLALFTFIYVIVETSIFIKNYIKKH